MTIPQTIPASTETAAAGKNFRISATDFFADLLMPQPGARLDHEAPSIRLNPVDLGTENVLERVERDQADVTLMSEGAVPDWAERRALFNSGLAVIARAGHPRLIHAGVAPGGTVPIDFFCDLGRVLMSPRPSSGQTGMPRRRSSAEREGLRWRCPPSRAWPVWSTKAIWWRCYRGRWRITLPA
jgi:DNA-binding transcriptional LysR family regulator